MFTSKQGSKIPQITFHTRQDDQWVDIDSQQLFAGKTVVVFSLPGAFTPTCSSSHLPRYDELADEFKALGVDEILCVSVNDSFVMNAWQREQGTKNIHFIPDGNGEFTRAMGMLVDKPELGFGPRSWRYSMLVKNGVIDTMFIEPQEPGDPFKVSDADTMLRHIAPNYRPQSSITLFSKPGCSYCIKAKTLLAERGLAFEEIELGQNASITSLRAITGKTTVPQVYIGGEHIGGSEELQQFLNASIR